jgi:hypothetical protein
MVELYTVFNNGSKEVRDMEKFFDENEVQYRTVYKPSDSRARIFPPNNQPSYDSRNFSSLKELIMEYAE